MAFTIEEFKADGLKIPKERQCGECSVCCFIGAVPELEKPPYTMCKYVKTSKCGSCSIYNSAKLPDTCRDFQCSWRRGFGSYSTDRPDKNGVMFSTNFIEGQFFCFAIETEEDAIKTTAKDMAVEVATKQKLPIIVSKHGTKPPNDSGDFVILHDDILSKAKNIAGELIYRLDDHVAMYKIIKTRQSNGNGNSSI